MSKKRSASKSKRQPSRLVFFIDRSLGSRLVPDALRKAGAQVEIHDDHFAQDEEDPVWLDAVGRKGWIVLTRDTRIRRRTIEKRALEAARVRAFVFTRGNVQTSQVAQIFVSYLPRMVEMAERERPPFIALITGSGMKLERTRRRKT